MSIHYLEITSVVPGFINCKQTKARLGMRLRKSASTRPAVLPYSGKFSHGANFRAHADFAKIRTAILL